MSQLVKDIDTVLQVPPDPDDLPEEADYDADPARPGDLWDPDGNVRGGANHEQEDLF